MSLIDQKRDELMYLFQGQKAKTLGKELASILNSGQLDFYQFGDFLTEFIRADAEFFTEKVYNIFARASKIAFGDLVALDQYIIEKYCLMDGEQILKIISGSVNEKKMVSSGRLFLTNFRLIICGSQQARSAQRSYHSGSALSMIAGSAIRGVVTSQRKNIRKAINRALSKETSAFNVLEWGYVYPVTNALKIKRTKSSIAYTIILDTEKRSVKLNLNVVPSRVRKEDKMEFQARKVDFLDELEKVLHHYAS